MSSTSNRRHGEEPSHELIRLRAELERAQQEKTRLERALADSRAELTRSVLARDEFITIAAHELRNPMSAIGLFVDRMLSVASSNPGACSSEIFDDLRRLERRIQHFVRRATVLLDVTRLLSGNLLLEFEEVNLTELVREAIQEHSAEFARADCELNVELQPGVRGFWDRVAIEQVLTNLLSNAAKYGSGQPVTVSLDASATRARLRVRDGGPGISERDQQRIFDKFERAVHERRQGGFGVGLWITRQLVEAHSGEIHVESKPARGSTFTVLLPLTHRKVNTPA